LDNWVDDFGRDTLAVRRKAQRWGTPEDKEDSAECDRLYEVLKKTRRDFVKGINLTFEKALQRAREEAAQQAAKRGDHNAP
jgi:hypothetical protein